MRRFELIIETAKHAFHDANLPPEAAEDIKQEIALAEQYLESYRSGKNRKIRAGLKNWKDAIGKFGRVFKAPFQDRLSQDYQKLQDATLSVTRHPLYYLANK